MSDFLALMARASAARGGCRAASEAALQRRALGGRAPVRLSPPTKAST
jgi:hypothetical protein